MTQNSRVLVDGDLLGSANGKAAHCIPQRAALKRLLVAEE
jgi:hypothetical protein